MKPILLNTLKHLALLGALYNKVEITSSDLATRLSLSQQTVSRHLIILEKQGYITREFGVRKQRIAIKEKGKIELEKEYLAYQRLFEMKNRVYIIGKVISGIGEGKYYTKIDGYVEQFKEKLGFVPVPGTLNIEVDPPDLSKLHLIRSRKGIKIESFSTSTRSFGEAMCYPAKLNNIDCVLIFPARTHHSNVIELIAPYNLREKLKLKDGDKVEVVVMEDEKSGDS